VPRTGRTWIGQWPPSLLLDKMCHQGNIAVAVPWASKGSSFHLYYYPTTKLSAVARRCMNTVQVRPRNFASMLALTWIAKASAYIWFVSTHDVYRIQTSRPQLPHAIVDLEDKDRKEDSDWPPSRPMIEYYRDSCLYYLCVQYMVLCRDSCVIPYMD
jgi:hypothetical protein